MTLLFIAALVYFIPLSSANLLRNGDFEHMGDWNCNGFNCQLTDDCHSGSHAYKVSGRTQFYHGPQQNINCVPNGRYSVHAFVKLYEKSHKNFGQSKVKITVRITFSGDSQYHYINAAELPMVWNNYWLELNGDFKVPNRAISECLVYVEGPDAGIEFVIDDFDIERFNDNPNWANEANANIFSSLRQATLNIKLTSENIDPNQVDIEVIQLKHEFPFGSAVDFYEIVNGDARYKDFIYKYFNWATLENALKWGFMEPNRYQINYDSAMNAIRALRGHGLKIRAHCILWSVDAFNPRWLQSLNGQQVKDAVTTRINGVVGHFMGLVEHWDVNNENLHGTFFQDKTGNPNYIKDVYKQVSSVAGNIKLFINDYDVVASGALTGAYLNQIEGIKQAGGGLDGIGVQAHFHPDEAPDPILIKRRLDTLARAGLDIWITELDVTTSDDNTRADWYEIVMRSFFGHPAVKGIILWGFWGGKHWRCDKASLVSAGNCYSTALSNVVAPVMVSQSTPPDIVI